jgi:hypothetical protein
MGDEPVEEDAAGFELRDGDVLVGLGPCCARCGRRASQALRPRPVHDWTSYAADSFRYLALTLDRRATHSGFYRRIDYPQHGVV